MTHPQAENQRAAADLNRVRSLNVKKVSSQREFDQARSIASIIAANLNRSEAERETRVRHFYRQRFTPDSSTPILTINLCNS